MKDIFTQLENTLIENGFTVKIFNNKREAKEKLISEIKKEDSVGIGGSITIEELEVYEELKKKGNSVFWHWRKDVENPINKAKDSDIYLTSTNALTMDGKFVNVDGNGNRVSSMFFGHRDVFIIVGKNKICDDYEAAKIRIDTIAGPKNAKRLKLNTPCVHTGKCSDCNSPDRICKIETIIHKNPGQTNIHVYLIDEELGY